MVNVRGTHGIGVEVEYYSLSLFPLLKPIVRDDKKDFLKFSCSDWRCF